MKSTNANRMTITGRNPTGPLFKVCQAALQQLLAERGAPEPQWLQAEQERGCRLQSRGLPQRSPWEEESRNPRMEELRGAGGPHGGRR